MAPQSEATVTPPSPSPPTNMSCTGASPPNPPNYTKNTMNDLTNWSATNPKVSPPPYFDDGAAGVLTTLAANTGALASGAGATAGGTEGTYPGAAAGAVPASTSVAHEGAGTEVVVTSPGSRAECPTQQVSVLGNYTANPNTDHASAKAPAVAPTITGLLPVTQAGTGGSGVLTVNGTGFKPSSVVTVGGVPMNTQYNSATQLKVLNAPKRTSAGNTPITVVTGGTATAATNWVFT